MIVIIIIIIFSTNTVVHWLFDITQKYFNLTKDSQISVSSEKTFLFLIQGILDYWVNFLNVAI